MMRFALIGSNFIVDQFVRAARLCEGAVLQTAYSRTPAQAQANAEKWGIPQACSSLEALAANPAVDAVYIATPNSLHFAQADAMLRAGKHVLCEKPIVPSEGALAPLLALARQRGLLLLEAIRPAYLPAVGIVRQLLPRLGTLRYAEFAYAQYSSRYDRYLQGIVENAFDPTLCNGTALDLGIYCVYWMLMLFGMPQRIMATASFLPGSIDTNGVALCAYGDMQVSLRYSKVHQSDRYAVIEGEQGSLRLSPFPIPTQAELRLRDGTHETLSLGTDADDMRYEIAQFMAMAQAPAQAEPYQHWSALALRVLDTIRTQAGIDFEKH